MYSVEVVKCPVCKQKLALQRYIAPGMRVVCANPKCDTTMRVVSRKPARVERVPFNQTRNADSSPESYG
jgi:ssDNA-binding Zn-finger/Zn-ribbon topoisomerase 1